MRQKNTIYLNTNFSRDLLIVNVKVGGVKVSVALDN